MKKISILSHTLLCLLQFLEMREVTIAVRITASILNYVKYLFTCWTAVKFDSHTNMTPPATWLYFHKSCNDCWVYWLRHH